ncbi:MAG TPA: FtsW/RodA/SpoVE family cell cycle protein [Candidatus Absconditabacterales bacterium]|nr:FtsW/RodA/SpoVE family cell cycle protein [Candidatus Absconditabacterales bacterium]
MPILATGAILILFGILAIYSVSIHESFGLTLKLVELGQYTEPSNYFYFFRQLRNLVVAIVLALIVYKIPLPFFKKEKNIVLIFILFLLFQLLVFVPQIGISLNGAKGWLYVPPIGTVQPSEFFKLGYVIFLSSWLLRKKKSLETKNFFTSFFIINGLILGIFLFIPDLGTVLVLGLVALVMARYAGVRAKIIGAILGGGF